jgi:hypothetical protein
MERVFPKSLKKKTQLVPLSIASELEYSMHNIKYRARYYVMKQTGIILLFLIYLSSRGHAQNSLTISGIVLDTTGNMIANATIRLSTLKDSVMTISRDDGSFNALINQSNILKLEVTIKGYLPFQKVYDIPHNLHKINLHSIILYAEYQQLQSFTISRIKGITIKEDTIKYHTAAFKMRTGDELQHLMKLLPGIIQDTSGNFIVEGKKLSRVLVNGQDYPGGNILTLLKSFPADIIQEIQVIDDYDDKIKLTHIKSGEANKVLNIVLKNQETKTTIGHFEFGMGNLGKYLTSALLNSITVRRQLTINAFATNNSPVGSLREKQIQFGYANSWGKQLQVNGDLSLSNDERSIESKGFQNNYYTGGTTQQTQSAQTIDKNKNFVLNYNVTYTPTANMKVRMHSFTGISRGYESVAGNYSTLERDSSFFKITNGVFKGNSNSKTITSISDIYFERISKHSKSRMSILATYRSRNEINNGSNSNFTNILLGTDTTLSNQTYLLRTGNPKKDWSADLNYFFPIGKNSFVQIGYNWNYSLMNYNRNTTVLNNQDSTLQIPDSSNNSFLFRDISSVIHTGYLTHSKKLNLTLNFDIKPAIQGGETEQKESERSYKYLNILPQAELSYLFGTGKRMTFLYKGAPTYPSLEQLNPIKDYTNAQYPTQGNQNLKSAYSHVILLHYEQTVRKNDQIWGFGLVLNYNQVQNAITTHILHSHDTSAIIQQTTFTNIGGYRDLKADYHMNFPSLIHKRLQINIDGGLTNNSIPAIVDSIPFNTININLHQSLNITLNIPEKVEFTGAIGYTHIAQRLSTEKEPTLYSSLNWVINSRHIFLKKWLLEYVIRQSYIYGMSTSLAPNPTICDITIKYDFIKTKRLSLGFSCFNLLDQNGNFSQSLTPTGLSQTSFAFSNRYFMLKAIWKFEITKL